MHGRYAFNPKPKIAYREAKWDGREIIGSGIKLLVV